jgi:hypothetical protein
MLIKKYARIIHVFYDFIGSFLYRLMNRNHLDYCFEHWLSIGRFRLAVRSSC